MPNDAFTLRFHDPRLRIRVRELASREGVPQNELIEEAIRHEVVLRGEMLADDLRLAAERLREMTEEQRAEWIREGAEQFARGEANPDPLRGYQVAPYLVDMSDSSREFDDPFGIVAAFSAPR